MRKRWLMCVAALWTAVTMTLGVGAATFESSQYKIKIETPDEKWTLMGDSDAALTVSDGKNLVTVNVFEKDSEIPMPGLVKDEYEEVFQIYYSTAEMVYCIWGCAVTKNDIKEVRSVVESFTLSNH